MMKIGYAVRLLAIAAILSLAAFVVAGCGGDEKKQDTVSADLSNGATGSASSSGDTKQFDSGETVGDAKKVVVASDADFSAEQQAIIARIADFADATANQDYKTLCNDLLSKKASQIGGDCVDTFEKSGGQIKDFKITVNSVKVDKDGKSATAIIDVSSNVNKQQDQTLSLVKEGGEWRIQILGQ